ncbi:MAG: recombinase family protein [Lachnospiraceae bacterium]|nr:recombinase family protein [Lachnospiraceae bacterium]
MARTSRKNRQSGSEIKKTPLKIYSVGIYARLSVDSTERKNESIDNQTELCRRYVAERDDLELFDCYFDLGRTGTNFEREGFERLMQDVRLRKVDCIVVKDLSRFGRNHLEMGNYLGKIFPFLGVRFIAISDHYDSMDGDPETLAVQLKNLVNDLYSKDLSVKVKTSIRSLKEQGNFLGSEAPFGYQKDPDDRHRLLIAEDEAEVVRRIFSMYEGGMSFVQIAKTLNSEGVKTPSQVRVEKGLRTFRPKNGIYLWNHSVILVMLKNRSYRGDLVQGTYESERLKGKSRRTGPKHWIVTENHHEPIIEPEQIDRIQERFSPGKKWKGIESHVLVGKLKCGCCGRNLRHCKLGHPYFWCAEKNISGLTGCVARAEDSSLEQLLMFRLQEHIMELGESSRLLEAEKNTARETLDGLRLKYQKTEQAITENRERQMRNYEKHVLEGAAFNASEDDEERLKEHLKELKAQLREAEDEVLRLEKESGFEVFAVKELTPELLDEYFKEIIVHTENDLEIVWKK